MKSSFLAALLLGVSSAMCASPAFAQDYSFLDLFLTVAGVLVARTQQIGDAGGHRIRSTRNT